MIEMKENSQKNTKKVTNPPRREKMSHSSEEVEIVSKFSEAENSLGFKKLIKSRKPKKTKKSKKPLKRNLSLKKTIKTKKKYKPSMKRSTTSFKSNKSINHFNALNN